MSTLFAKKRKLSSGRKRSLPQSSADTSSNLPADGVTGKSGDIRGPATTGTASEGCEGDVSNSSRQGAQRNPQAIREMEVQGFDSPAGDGAMRGEGCGAGTTFESLGLCEWLLTACKAMGFRRPTPVQAHCIPAILKGKDVLGCAETGSGKTAAFALPILHELSKDPYGVFAIVLTPTRELALQISEQFDALGAPMGLRHAVVIGGVGLLEQSVQLAGRPHVIVATPGRLRDHLQGQDAPALRKCRYLVLDEADRLMAQTFQSELKCITAALPGSRQTLLFSATMTSNLEALQSLALTDPVKYDLTKKATVPAALTQEYLFMPQQMKTCFVVQTLRMLASDNLWIDSDDDEGMGWKGRGKRDREDSGIGGHEDEDAQEAGRARSVMIFVSKCRRCHELAETLLELGVDCTPLHSLLGQRRRIAALGKFKSQQTRVLVSTDVASRGLDIPVVDLVINFDVPRVATDYVHRVGRTARAGRRGRAVSLVSQYDINLVHNIEKYTGVSLQLCSEVVEEDVLNLLNRVAKASKVAKMRLMDQGFDERESAVKERNNRQKAAKLGVGQEITGSRGGPQAAVKRATAGGSEKTKPRRGPSASKARKGLKKVG